MGQLKKLSARGLSGEIIDVANDLLVEFRKVNRVEGEPHFGEKLLVFAENLRWFLYEKQIHCLAYCGLKYKRK